MAAIAVSKPDRWNHNIHYGLKLLKLVPPNAQDGLDVGCGDGWLVHAMRSRVARVIGIDPDPNCIALARTAPGGSNGEFVRADLFAYPAAAGSFDFITCVAALHHMEEERALRRMAVLLRPGGTLVVVGLAQSRLPADLRWEIAGAIATRLHKLTKNYGETTAPKVWPPPHTYDEMRDIFGRVLPGSRFRRVILWRYVATWTKPAP